MECLKCGSIGPDLVFNDYDRRCNKCPPVEHENGKHPVKDENGNYPVEYQVLLLMEMIKEKDETISRQREKIIDLEKNAGWGGAMIKK